MKFLTALLPAFALTALAGPLHSRGFNGTSPVYHLYNVADNTTAPGIESIPLCAIPCIKGAVEQETHCKLADISCLCHNRAAIAKNAKGCVIRTCGLAKALKKVNPRVKKLCKAEDAKEKAKKKEEEKKRKEEEKARKEEEKAQKQRDKKQKEEEKKRKKEEEKKRKEEEKEEKKKQKEKEEAERKEQEDWDNEQLMQKEEEWKKQKAKEKQEKKEMKQRQKDKQWRVGRPEIDWDQWGYEDSGR